jgi:hypothetical protein
MKTMFGRCSGPGLGSLPPTGFEEACEWLRHTTIQDDGHQSTLLSGSTDTKLGAESEQFRDIEG